MDALAAAKKKVHKKSAQVDGHPAGEGAPEPSVSSRSKAHTLGVYGGLAYQKYTMKETETKVEFGGPALEGGVAYELNVAPKLSIPLTAGLSIISASGQSLGGEAKLTLTVNTLDFGVAALYAATPDFAIGGGFEYDYGISGSLKLEFGSFNTSTALSSYSTMGFGLLGRYALSKTSKLGFEFWSLTGSLQGESSDSATFDATRIRFAYIYLF